MGSENVRIWEDISLLFRGFAGFSVCVAETWQEGRISSRTVQEAALLAGNITQTASAIVLLLQES